MWSARNEKSGTEVSKCRHRVVSYLGGVGLDLGCGEEKIVGSAIGIDIGKYKGTDLSLDLSANDALGIFSDNYFDYIFSAHLLEDFICIEPVLHEWWKKIKPGGHLILYCPDADYYPRCGTPGANKAHKSDLYWKDAWKIIKKFGNARKVGASRHNNANEYSWLLVVKKTVDYIQKVRDMLAPSKNGVGRILFPRVRKTKKECLVIRYGAIGDAIWMTPVLKKLKEDGYHIVYNCSPYSAQVLKLSPHIDEFLIQEKNAIPNENLGPYWKTISQGFDKVLNFSETIERTLLKCEGRTGYDWSHEKRHELCNVNYADHTMKCAGYPNIKGSLPELHFSEIEEALAKHLRDINKDKFLILWALSGSSFHKIYPWAAYIAGSLDHNYEDIRIITVGDYPCKILEWRNKNTMQCSGGWTIRQSMIMAKYVDLVIGPETGVLNAASCWDTPKIVFLSHSSEENLTKYWKNTTAMMPPDCECYPCHQLHYSDCCPKGPKGVAAKCSETIDPELVYDKIVQVYEGWKGVH